MIKSYSESDTFGLRPYPDRIEEEQDGEYPPQSDPGGLRLSTGSKSKMKRRRYASRRAVSLQDTPMYLVEQYNFATVQVIEEKRGKLKREEAFYNFLFCLFMLAFYFFSVNKCNHFTTLHT